MTSLELSQLVYIGSLVPSFTSTKGVQAVISKNWNDKLEGKPFTAKLFSFAPFEPRTG